MMTGTKSGVDVRGGVFAAIVLAAELVGNAPGAEGDAGAKPAPTGGVAAAPARAEETKHNLDEMQLWNSAYWQTTLLGDYYGPNSEIEKLKPISLAGCRNGTFSGQVVVTSTNKNITGLKTKMSDLVNKEGHRIPVSCTRIRYPELAREDTSWSPSYRFDRFMDKPPQEIKMDKVDLAKPSADPLGNMGIPISWYGLPLTKPKNVGPVAMQPIWVTVSVPANAAPGQELEQLAGAAAYILGKGTQAINLPIKIKGTPQQIQAITDAIVSSKRFQEEISKPGATVDSVIEKLRLRNLSKQQFETIVGLPWPL